MLKRGVVLRSAAQVTQADGLAAVKAVITLDAVYGAVRLRPHGTAVIQFGTAFLAEARPGFLPMALDGFLVRVRPRHVGAPGPFSVNLHRA